VAYAAPMRTRIGRILALLTSLSLLLLTLAATSPVAAQSGDDCVLSVKPKNGGPGTEFVFTGSGYAPTRIVLKREGGPSKTVEVTPGQADDFTIRLIAGKGDAGTWRATAIEPDGCRASVAFSVGLPPTSTPGTTEDGRTPALAGLAALGLLFVLSSIVVLPRVTRSARSR
jgi:hypothetical protein